MGSYRRRPGGDGPLNANNTLLVGPRLANNRSNKCRHLHRTGYVGMEAVQVRWFEALKMKTRRATGRTPVGSDLPFAARMVAT